MISVEEALERVFELVTPLGTEIVPLARADGRFMAKPAIAIRDQPPFSASAMDGYAVNGVIAPGTVFDVIGTASAGHAWDGLLNKGQAVRIFTGAPVPEGTQSVIIQEDVTANGGKITLSDRLGEGDNIRQKGQDFCAGDTLAPRLLRPTDLALLAAMNVAEVEVTRQPVVALIATGDELVLPGEVPRPDQIIASNSFALKAMAEREGAIARLLPIARDTEADLRIVFDLAQGADLIVTIGGASVGDHDLVGKVASQMGMDRAFYKVAMRPGKPLMAGKLRGTPLLGLPGNPVSSVVCGHIFMIPVIRALLGLGHLPQQPLRAVLGEDVAPTGPRTHFMRAQLSRGKGLPKITPFERQDSALLGVLSKADALLIRPVGDGPQSAGAEVDYLPI